MSASWLIFFVPNQLFVPQVYLHGYPRAAWLMGGAQRRKRSPRRARRCCSILRPVAVGVCDDEHLAPGHGQRRVRATALPRLSGSLHHPDVQVWVRPDPPPRPLSRAVCAGGVSDNSRACRGGNRDRGRVRGVGPDLPRLGGVVAGACRRGRAEGCQVVHGAGPDSTRRRCGRRRSATYLAVSVG